MSCHFDETARQIFLAAQNEMIAMKASGRLDVFATDLKESGIAVNRAPADYPAGDESWKNLYAVSASALAAKTYLLRAGSALQDAAQGGDFLLELSPTTGDVYGAFYSPDPIDYSEVQTLCIDSRDRSVRQLERLGYYGGSMSSSGAVGVPKEFFPQVSVHNGEELFLSVTCGDLLLLRGTQSSLLLTVTVTDEHDGSWSKSWSGGTNEMFVNRDSVTVPLVLDSLDSALAFRTVTDGALTPGDNLTVAAVMSYAHNGVNISGAAAPVTVNSLFDSRDGEGNLTVSRVRHLQNLQADRYPGSSGRTITQAETIQFAFETWKKGADFYSDWTQSPLTVFAPIKNTALLTNATYDGCGNALVGFPITGVNTVGLFAAVTGGVLRNIRLVDCAVTATGSGVGALAGKVTGTAVENCGVFLTSLDEYGRFLEDMPQRLERYSVTGNGYVGGLIGNASGSSSITDSFAAVQVTSQSEDIAGGLVGFQDRGAVRNCYASGSVSGVNFVGGLVGYNGGGGLIADCYSAAQVTSGGTNAVGGLVSTTTGKLSNCTVYGQVNTASALSGGIAAYAALGAVDCRYLSQAGYNDMLGSTVGTPADYLSLKAAVPNAADSSRPYQGALVGNAFPFPLLTRTLGQAGPMTHYGNWPAEFRLQTSLVYYERYENNTYGYFARTSLTAEAEIGEDGQQANTWVVDTLQDKVCVEDGYALLTTAALDRFTYSRNGGAVQTVQVSAQEGKTTALPLESNVSLQFENDNGSTYSITGARAYRLPYALQTTGHTSAANSFYDRLTIGETGDGKTYQFYYCGDFAKNAVNPDLNNQRLEYPADPSGAVRPVYVRSARQLHLLGRTIYYWGDQNSSLDFYFLQEAEIDFGKYVKRYCGEPYDMTDTSENNSHRNLPIGRTGGSSGKQFRATYDGGGNPIVDYRCVTYPSDGYQFTGLFGEIYKATLKNIVMTASDPANKSGYVESNFYNATDAYRPGVGALVGLVYVDQGEAESTYAAIANCAVSGYTVRYTGTGTKDRAYAVGGLAGFCFGKISNASAVSYCVDGVSGAGNKYVGGLVGSLNGRGSVTRCYAGGTLKMSSASGIRSVGGISGGFEDIYGYGTGGYLYLRAMQITDCYSYCTLNSASVKSGTSVAGVSPANYYLTVENSYYLSNQVSGVSVDDVFGAAAKTAAELMTLGDALGGGSAVAGNTYPWSVALQNKAYSFPAFVKVGEDYVHYGDWPRPAAVPNTLGFVYTRTAHVLTLEDPIEYIYTPDTCAFNQREIGRDTGSYAAGLRAALREDPDILLIGELRDLDTIETALTAAETGHLVLATLHTASAADSVDRIVDVFPEARQRQIRLQLSQTLQAVLAQQLLPDKTGQARIAACELMVVTPAIRNLIREGKTPQIANAIATGAAEGAVTMDAAILRLYQAGRITAETARLAAHDPDYVKKALVY